MPLLRWKNSSQPDAAAPLLLLLRPSLLPRTGQHLITRHYINGGCRERITINVGLKIKGQNLDLSTSLRGLLGYDAVVAAAPWEGKIK